MTNPRVLLYQQTPATYDPEQSPRAYAEDWLEEPADTLLEVSASGYGDIVLVDPDMTWDQIREECGGAGVLVAVGTDVLLWTEPDPEPDEQFTDDLYALREVVSKRWSSWTASCKSKRRTAVEWHRGTRGVSHHL